MKIRISKKTAILCFMVLSVMLISMYACTDGTKESNLSENVPVTTEPSVTQVSSVTIVDSMGEQVQVSYQPERVVSLYGPPTEVICALGCADSLVGVSAYCTFPPVVREKVQVGAPSTPSVEKIVEVMPDIVFAFRGGYGADLDPDIETKIEEAGIPVIFINCLEPDELAADIKKMGEIFG
jgi:iron complex transport system substrate-binding protein